MKNFVISLENAKARRGHIQQEFNKKNVEFTFFDAINTSQVAEFSQKLKLNLAHADLTEGEKACLLSHVVLWNKAVEENLSFIAIYEDDIYLGEDIQAFFQDDSWISLNMDIIKLEVFSKSALMELKKIPVANGRHLRKLKGEHLGAAGYILSQKSAKTLLEYIQGLDRIIPVDHILFEIFIEQCRLNVYQMSPGICIQSDRLDSFANTQRIESQLELERRERLDTNALQYKKIKKSFLFKIKREYQRFILKLRMLLGRIGFK